MSRARLPLAQALDAHCARLEACRTCRHGADIVPTISTARAPRAMLVGQAPGQVEMHGGKPFAGRAGRTLFKWLEEAGLDEDAARESLYIAAVTRCYPGPHPGGRGDRVPTREERERCSGWLDDELRIIRPRLVIPVGRLAIDRFLGAVPLDAVVGRQLQATHPGGTSIVIPLPHPSGASSWIHAPGNRALLDRSLALIRAHLVTPRRSAA